MEDKRKKRKKNKPGAVVARPHSPAGLMKNKKGKTVNAGLADPMAPSWRQPPFAGTFKV